MTDGERLAAAIAELYAHTSADAANTWVKNLAEYFGPNEKGLTAAMERYVMWEAVFLLEPQPRLTRRKAEAISSAITRFIKSSLPR